jgi:hypothetical protein
MVVQSRAPRLTWLVGSIAVAIAWGLTWGLASVLPTTTSLSAWEPVELFGSTLQLTLDLLSWKFVFCTLTVVLSIALTALARPVDGRRQVQPFTLVYPALAMLPMMAGNLLTVAMAWALMDIVTFLYSLNAVDGGEGVQRLVVRLGIDGGGILLVLAAALANLRGGEVEASVMSPWAVGLLAMAVLLKLGLLPPHFMFPAFTGVSRELGTLLRLLPPAAALSVLARQFSYGLADQMRIWLGLAGLVGLLVGGLGWAMAEDVLAGRRRLVMAVSGVGMLGASLVEVQPGMPVEAAGLVLLLVGAVVSLGEIYSTWHRLIPGMAMLMIGGMPGSPCGGYSQALAEGLLSSRGAWLAVGGIIGLALLAAGMLRKAFSEIEEWPEVEDVSKVVYGIGLVLPIVAGLGIGIGWKGLSDLGVVDAALFVFVAGMGCAAALLSKRLPRYKLLGTNGLARLMEANSMPRGLQRMGEAMMGGVRAVGRMLEGEGGMLWLYAVLLAIALALMGARL